MCMLACMKETSLDRKREASLTAKNGLESNLCTRSSILEGKCTQVPILRTVNSQVYQHAQDE